MVVAMYSYPISHSYSYLSLGVAAFAGLLSHLTLFIHGEWHNQGPSMVLAAPLIVAALVVIHFLAGFTPTQSAQNTFLLTTTFLTTLFLSIFTYRMLFHPLRHFPGPRLAAATKFWHSWHSRTSQNYLLLENLRQRYGHVVRTGPNELLVVTPTIPAAIDGPGSPCLKAPFYDIFLPFIAINTTRDRIVPDRRRAIWNRGFTSTALAEYRKYTVKWTHELDHFLAEANGKALDVSTVFYWFTFDLVGELAIGQSFGQLKQKRWHPAVNDFRKAVRLYAPLTPVFWLARILNTHVPWFWAFGDWHKWHGWFKGRMSERLAEGAEELGVAAQLVKASTSKGAMSPEEWAFLAGDAFTIIVAGSDVPAYALVYAFYYLARDQSLVVQLRKALEELDLYNHEDLEKCEYLNGFLNEVFRLHPPVPTQGYRQTPPDGLRMDDLYIPGNVTVIAPRYSLGRSEACYVDADSFIPERWSSKPELVKDSRGFNPFGQGRYGCVGKALGLQQLRFIAGFLVTKYDVAFAPSEDGTTLIRDTLEYFTSIPGKLDLVFKPVSGT